MFLKSIRFSLTLRYCLTLAIILALFSCFLYATIRKQLYREVDRDLLTIAQALASPTLEPFRNSPASVFDQVLEDFIGPKVSGKFVQLFDNTGTATTSSDNLRGTAFPLSKAALRKASLGAIAYETEHRGSLPLRTIIFPVVAEGNLTRIVEISAPLEDISAILGHIFVVLCISIPLAICLFGYGGWFLAGQALKPVGLLTRSARRITAENLGDRLEVVNAQDELGQLAETFNETLSRLENSFKRTRRFSVDVSHELRTPLTILRGETELGLKLAKEPDEFRELLASNLDEIKQMSKIIEDLLFLSKAEEGGLYLDLQEVELFEFLQEIKQQSEPVAQEAAVALFLEGESPVYIRGDRLRLKQVFLNLVENGIRYNKRGGEVRLELKAEGGEAAVAVSDTGVGIPQEDLPFIYDRFYRVDKARNRTSGGSGLGLSLVKSFTAAHGGKIEVASEIGKGTRFLILLPLAAKA